MQVPKQLLRAIASMENQGPIVLTVHTDGRNGWALKTEKITGSNSSNAKQDRNKNRNKDWSSSETVARTTTNFDKESIELIDLRGIGNIY